MHEALNQAKPPMLFRKEFGLCNVQKDETIVLLSDLGARRDYVQAALAAAEDFGADIYDMCINATPSWNKVGVATVGCRRGTLEAIKAADMLTCLRRADEGHYDVPMRDCTVTLDNAVIIERGKFADEKMQIARVAC